MCSLNIKICAQHIASQIFKVFCIVLKIQNNHIFD